MRQLKKGAFEVNVALTPEFSAYPIGIPSVGMPMSQNDSILLNNVTKTIEHFLLLWMPKSVHTYAYQDVISKPTVGRLAWVEDIVEERII